jgi:hypothetical protein
MKNNSNKISTKPAYVRCEYRFANGMRCSLPCLPGTTSERGPVPSGAPNPELQFCSRHAKLAQAEPIEQDLSKFILKGSQDFQTAQGVNFSLANIFELLAKNRISPRRAAVLAYIASLLLRTHASIDRELALNEENTASVRIDFGDLPRPNRNGHPAQNPDATKHTAVSAPEPDPTKKPS